LLRQQRAARGYLSIVIRLLLKMFDYNLLEYVYGLMDIGFFGLRGALFPTTARARTLWL